MKGDCMKKILAVATMSTLSLSCIAKDITISINNESSRTVKVVDQDSHQTSILAQRTGQMLITLRKQQSPFSTSPIIKPEITTLKVDDGDRASSITVDENTKTVTVGYDFKLDKKQF